MTLLLVALGAAVGAPLRFVLDRFVQRRHRSALPWGTITVNLAGSAILGALIGLGQDAGGGWSALLGVGFCGALTTYSTFGYETLRLATGGARTAAVLNVTVSLCGGLAAASVGVSLGGALGGM